MLYASKIVAGNKHCRIVLAILHKELAVFAPILVEFLVVVIVVQVNGFLKYHRPVLDHLPAYA